MMRLALLACLICLTTPALADTPEMVFAEAAKECAAQDNGVFAPGDAAVSEFDLTGDGVPEQIVNAAGFQCSTLAALYGGTGGNRISVLAGGKRFDWMVLGYQVVKTEWGPPVLLMAVHGSRCHSTGDQPCYEAVVWGADGFLSVAASEAE
jgi:hypothetical protein